MPAPARPVPNLPRPRRALPEADAIVVGAGLAGLVATAELADAGRRVILRRPGAGGVARRAGVLVARRALPRRLARSSGGCGSRTRTNSRGRTGSARAGFDRPEDEWPRRWAEAYVDFAAGEKRAWLHAQGVRCLPNVGWAERGGYRATGTATPSRASTSPGAPGPGVHRAVRRGGPRGAARGLVDLRFRHRVDALTVTDGAVDGVARHGARARRACARGRSSSRDGRRRVRAARAGGDRHLRRHRRQPRARARATGPSGSAPPPKHMISGVPAHVDGRMIEIAEAAGGDVDQPRPHVALHRGHPATGTRSGRGTASGSCPARRRCGSTRPARRLPVPLFPGFDTLGTLEHIMRHRPRAHVVRADAEDHREGVRALRLGAEPGHHRQERPRACCRRASAAARPAPVEAFKRHGADFVVEPTTCARSSTG